MCSSAHCRTHSAPLEDGKLKRNKEPPDWLVRTRERESEQSEPLSSGWRYSHLVFQLFTFYVLPDYSAKTFSSRSLISKETFVHSEQTAFFLLWFGFTLKIINELKRKVVFG